MFSVREFYKDKTILVTGGSGFMGKVLIEKLLRSCSDLKQILILMRSKRGKTGEERIEAFGKIPLFEKLLEENPSALTKLVPVYGDISKEKFDLSNDHLSLVLRETNIVFHFAATLNFKEPIKTAVQMNIKSLDTVITLSKMMKNLNVVVHLSTAFCNPDQKVLNEKIYDFKMKPRQLINVTDNLSDEIIDSIEEKLITPHPNTYTYTKRVAELLVVEEYKHLPICIVRPSIVVPTLNEPIAGWVDNLNGPVGLTIASGKGLVRTALGNGTNHIEFIPCDLACNGIIVFAAKVGSMKEKPESVPVYNLTVKPESRVTWNMFVETALAAVEINPLNMGLWYPNCYFTMSPVLHYTHLFISQWLPALFIDLILVIMGRKRALVDLQKKIYAGSSMLQYFTSKEWNFCNEQDFANEISSEENEIFPTDVKIDFLDAMAKCALGCRRYILKEKDEDLPKARKQLKILYAIDVISNLFRVFLLGWLMNFLAKTLFGFHISNFLQGH